MKARRSLALSVYSCSITDRAKTDHVEGDGTAKWTCCLGAMAPFAVLAVCCSLLAAERGRRVNGKLHSSRELTARRQCASTFWIVAADEEGDGDLDVMSSDAALELDASTRVAAAAGSRLVDLHLYFVASPVGAMQMSLAAGRN